MSVTIGVVANVYNEANALPGWIESAITWADWIGVMHAGPQGSKSNDGTLEILEKWNIPVQFCAIDDGFGVVRTKTLRMCPCDYIMLLDADERFFPIHRVINCSGKSTPHDEVDAILQTYDFHDLKTMIPNWENISRLGAELKVNFDTIYNQEQLLRDILNLESPDAVCTVRRHWHDFSFKRPTQNWFTDPDWQMRLVRNKPSIHFSSDTKMHERLVGADKVTRSNTALGPFFDHFHFTFKHMEQEQRAHDVVVYDSIHAGKVPPTLDEFTRSKV